VPNGWHEGLGKACYGIENYKKDDFLDDLGKRAKSRQLLPVHLHAFVRQNFI
jgi:hypothetical protein